MIYAGHHMAGRVPQNGRYFQFLRTALYSSFSTFPRSRFLSPDYTSVAAIAPACSRFLALLPRFPIIILFFVAFFYTPPSSLCDSTLSFSLPFPLPALIFRRFSNVLLESDSIFTPAVLSYGAAIFHDLILERGKKHAGEEG